MAAFVATEWWPQSWWSFLCSKSCPASCCFPAEWNALMLPIPASAEHLCSSGFYIKLLYEKFGSAFKRSISERGECAEMTHMHFSMDSGVCLFSLNKGFMWEQSSATVFAGTWWGLTFSSPTNLISKWLLLCWAYNHAVQNALPVLSTCATT